MADLKNQEDSQLQVTNATVKSYQELIDQKEYELQNLESKVYHYEKYLQRKSFADGEARNLLVKYAETDIGRQRVTNVIEENQNLRIELKAAFLEVNKLEISNIKQKQLVFQFKEKCENMKTTVKE